MLAAGRSLSHRQSHLLPLGAAALEQAKLAIQPFHALTDLASFRASDPNCTTSSSSREAQNGGCTSSEAARSVWPTHQSCRGFAGSAGDSNQQEKHPDGGANASEYDDPSQAQLMPAQMEGEVDDLMDRWEAMMDANAAPEEILEAVMEDVDSVPGLPPWENILEMGDQEEAEERLRRRSREQQLQEEFAEKRKRVVDQFGRSYATGKRKTSIARTWIKAGSGAFSINGRTLDEYFHALQRRADVLLPLRVTDNLGNFDVYATVKGGGTTGQAQALRHGISRALQLYNPEMRPTLKAAGLLTRDSRIVERKKPGLAKARKAFQWVKR